MRIVSDEHRGPAGRSAIGRSGGTGLNKQRAGRATVVGGSGCRLDLRNVWETVFRFSNHPSAWWRAGGALW